MSWDRRLLKKVTIAAVVSAVVLLWVGRTGTPRRYFRNRSHLSFGISDTSSEQQFHTRRDELLGGQRAEEAHRGLLTAGVPGEGLLLAEINSDEAAVDEFGDGIASDSPNRDGMHAHKPLIPLNR